MKLDLLKLGDCIGLASPSWPVTEEDFAPICDAIRAAGFSVKLPDKLFSRGWGFVASPEERADTLHQLVRDDDVKLIFFGGGEGGDDVIPYLDYDLIAKHPKLWLSFSDGTSILSAVHFRTGLNVFYDQSPNDFINMDDYAKKNFFAHILDRTEMHLKSGSWQIVKPGKAKGKLVGGYLENFTYLANAGWITPEADTDYVLALEEHEQFFGVPHVSDELARLENSPIMKQTKGILFGHYSEPTNQDLLRRLKILAAKHAIPLAYCDDFGHGKMSAILRFGETVELDCDCAELTYLPD